MENSSENDLSSDSNGRDVSENWIPNIGMEFNSVNDASNFWLNYGGKMGFNVRKAWTNTSKKDKTLVTSTRFLCAKEGFRCADKRDHLTVSPRAERRTGCMVGMSISLVKATGKYRVHDFVSEHNHVLHSPETSHLMPSQRKISEVQAIEIELADEFGIQPRAAHEYIGAHVGGTSNLGYTRRDHKNYLRSKRQRDLMYGEAGSMLKYFHLQTIENPSFQYSVQLDCEEKITNIFWADAKMIIDYASFGDVVAFDTTFGTNKEGRPLGVFVGFNQFRETTVFGAALLYDETKDSFKWLFETFLATHDNKQPKTLFTDQHTAMGIAITEVMPNVWHGLCTWHIKENATKHLLKQGVDVFRDFKACMYNIKTEAEFEETFKAMRAKVKDDTWLDYIYRFKEKWVECYMTNVFSIGMRSTQLSESFNSDLKDYLKCNMDVIRFFKQFERVLALKRQNEVQNEYDAKENLPRIKMRRNPLLKQAGQLYTPKIFESFQDEYEWSTTAYIKDPVEGKLSNEYRVAISDPENDSSIGMEYDVFGDASTKTVLCSCEMFERLGILCAHALKVLDVMNIKQIPEKYILKCWTREARSGIVQDNRGRTVLEDPQLEATRRYRALCQKFVKVACRAYNYVEMSSLLDNGLDNLIGEVDKLSLRMKEQRSQAASVVPDLNTPIQPGGVESFIPSKVSLKKKEAKNGGKRRKSWTEKFHNDRRVSSKKEQPNHQNKENRPPQQVENQRVVEQRRIGQGKNYLNPQNSNNTYMQLLLGESRGSQEQLGSNLWKQTPFLSHQVLDEQVFSQELSSQITFDDLSNVNWLGL